MTNTFRINKIHFSGFILKMEFNMIFGIYKLWNGGIQRAKIRGHFEKCVLKFTNFEKRYLTNVSL